MSKTSLKNIQKQKKKAKRIANKCDHCLGYSDLACISACPTAISAGRTPGSS